MIDVAQLDCMLAYNTGITSYMISGLKPHEIRKKYPRAHMAGGLRQTTDGGWVQIAGHRPKALDRLREELGVEEVTQEVFDEVIAGKTRDELVEYMVNVGIPIAPVYDLPEIEGDPHIVAREMIIEVDHPKAGKVRSVNFPVKFSETPVEEMRPAPLFGQHNKEVLVDLLGYSDERFRELKKEGVVLGE